MSNTTEICVSFDFDGTLSDYCGNFSSEEILDDPVEGSIEYLIQLLEDHEYAVAIFSSRNKYDHNIMRSWILKHMSQLIDPLKAAVLIKDLQFPLSKQPSFIHIDDRCIQFTGKFPPIEEIKNFTPYFFK